MQFHIVFCNNSAAARWRRRRRSVRRARLSCVWNVKGPPRRRRCAAQALPSFSSFYHFPFPVFFFPAVDLACPAERHYWSPSSLFELPAMVLICGSFAFSHHWNCSLCCRFFFCLWNSSPPLCFSFFHSCLFKWFGYCLSVLNLAAGTLLRNFSHCGWFLFSPLSLCLKYLSRVCLRITIRSRWMATPVFRLNFQRWNHFAVFPRLVPPAETPRSERNRNNKGKGEKTMQLIYTIKTSRVLPGGIPRFITSLGQALIPLFRHAAHCINWLRSFWFRVLKWIKLKWV